MTGAQSRQHKEALRLAALGWRVFPVFPRGKAPATKTGFKAATTNESIIDAWWSKRDWNVGLALPSNAMVIDLDTVAIDDLAHDGMLIPPECPISATPRKGGGNHVWFRIPEGFASRPKVAVLPGIDIRAHGSYVVVPPSIHPSGGEYRWIEHLNNPAEDLPLAPEWALNLLTMDDFVDHRDPLDVDSILEKVEPGRRHTTAFRYACRMRTLGYHKKEASIILQEALRRWDTGDYKKPVEQAASSIINSVWKRYEQGARKEQKRGWTLDRLMAEDLGTIQWMVDDILHPGVCLVWSDPKVGKSMVISNLALSIATGSRAWGRYVVQKPRGVLLLDLEQSESSGQERWRRVLDGKEPPENIHVFFEWPTQDEGGLEELKNYLCLHSEIEVVIIDVMSLFFSQRSEGSNAYHSEYHIIQNMKKLAKEFGIALILVHHTNKSGGVSGSQAMRGAPDILMELIREENDTFATMKITGKNLRQGEIYFNVDFGKMQWIATGDAF